MVREDSIKLKESSEIEFIVEDGENYILVNYTGMLPDLFREGQGVICEGKVDENSIFTADKILAKHDENYMSPEVKAAMDAAKLLNAEESDLVNEELTK